MVIQKNIKACQNKSMLIKFDKNHIKKTGRGPVQRLYLFVVALNK